jgi:alcohol dehydrogenase (cytochrome c)
MNRLATRSWPFLVFALAASAVSLDAQVSFDRLVRAKDEPHNWLTYSGSYLAQRHSELTQITRGNVKDLELAWIFQVNSREPSSTHFEATPLVVDGVLYTVQPPNDIVALNAATGRPFWTFSYTPSPQARFGCAAGA